MKNIVSKISLSLLAIGLTVSSFAQFQGEIKFEKTKGNIHVNYKYYVKGDKVRVEEVSDDGAIDGIQLMDLKENKVYALSPERKLYMEAPNRRPAAELSVDVKKTGKSKEVLGYKCYEYVVTNKAEDRKIVYWITKGEYNFFIPMLKTLNRKEKQAMYYLKIDGVAGHFPMLSTEYILSSGDVVSELKATKVSDKDLKQALFEVPAGYTKFER